jgi:hypothetical protein
MTTMRAAGPKKATRLMATTSTSWRPVVDGVVMGLYHHYCKAVSAEILSA